MVNLLTFAEIVLLIAIIGLILLLALAIGGIGKILFRMFNEQNRLIKELTDKVMSISWQDYTAGKATEEKAKIPPVVDTRLKEELAIAKGRRQAMEEMGINSDD